MRARWTWRRTGCCTGSTSWSWSWASRASTWTTTVGPLYAVEKLSKVDLILTQLDSERRNHIEQINSLSKRTRALEEEKARSARAATALEEAGKAKDGRIEALNEQVEGFLRMEKAERARREREELEEARRREESGEKESEEVRRLQEELGESGRVARERERALEEMVERMRAGEEKMREEGKERERRLQEALGLVEGLRGQVAELEGRTLAMELEKENVREVAESHLSVSVLKEEGENPEGPENPENDENAETRDKEVFDSMLHEEPRGGNPLDSIKIGESKREMDEIFKFRESIRATIRMSKVGPGNPFESNSGHRQSVVRRPGLKQCATASSLTS